MSNLYAKSKNITARYDNIIKMAEECGIEVIWAKNREDAKIKGVHLVEPSYARIILGLENALLNGTKIVVVHSSRLKPYLKTY